MTRILAALMVSTFGMTATALAGGTASPWSGRYGPLTVIVSGGAISGTFFAVRGEPDSSTGVPPFSCIFLLNDTMHGDRGYRDLDPGDRNVIRGEQPFGGDEASLQLQTKQAGCDVEGDAMSSGPDSLPVSDDDKGWIGVGMLDVDRAYLRSRRGRHDDADDSRRHAADAERAGDAWHDPGYRTRQLRPVAFRAPKHHGVPAISADRA